MISRFSYGHVIETEAILQKPAADNGVLPLLSVDEASLSFTYSMADDDKVYGLGENVRGINKRGWIYQSKCSDEPEHLEDRRSLYGAHNFFVVSGKETFGIFIDYPGILTFDIGYTRYSELKITASDWNLDVYVITGERCQRISFTSSASSSAEASWFPNGPSVTARAAGAICPRTRSGTW